MSVPVMKQVELTSAICSAVAIFFSAVRLFIRRKRIAAEDIHVALSMLFILAQLSIISSYGAIGNGFTRFYAFMLTFYGTVWFARLSVLYSIIRIATIHRWKRMLFPLAVLFYMVAGLLFAQVLWVCEPQRKAGRPYCRAGKQVAIFQLVSDVIADLILLVVPVHLFCSIQEIALRRRLTVLFSTCILTTMVSLAHAVLLLKSQGLRVMIAAVVETSVSLIVASIPILTSALYGAERHEHKAKQSLSVPIAIHFATHSLVVVSESTLVDSHTFRSPSSTTFPENSKEFCHPV